MTTGFCIPSCPLGTCPSLDFTKCFEDFGCELVSAELFYDWTTVSIEFTKLIDGSMLPIGIVNNTSGLCDYWFAPATVALLGTGYKCSYIGKNVTL